MEATREALFRLERWSEYWCYPSKQEAFFSVNPHQANFLLHPASVSIPLQLFSGSPSTGFFFLNMYLRWRPSFSYVSRPYAVSLLSHGAPLRSPSLFCIKLFFGPFSHVLHPDGFLSQALPISWNWNALTERPVAPSPAASRLPLSHFFFLRLLYLPYESPWLILLFHLMSWLFVSQPPFLF